jgi:hypothetical protein
MVWDASLIGALWVTVALLAGGYARTRNRSAWTWFLMTLVFGPIAAFLLVTWPARELANEAVITQVPEGVDG